MPRVNVKPMSANRMWKGRRSKTPEYLAYEKELFYELPRADKSLHGKRLTLKIEIGVSNYAFDLDNMAKPFIDILQNKYNFNDKMIYKLEMEKKKVPAGKEYIEFEFYRYVKKYD